jgi:hypothetical protein
MGTLGGFPSPPAKLRCQQSWQAPHAIGRASGGDKGYCFRVSMADNDFDARTDTLDKASPRSLRQVRAAQLRARALRWAIGKSTLGSLFLVGALAYALGPQRHTGPSRLWMAFLLVLSTVNVGLGLRTFSRVRRQATRYWPVATAAWGVLATVVVRILMRR